MKKIVTLLLLFAMALSLCACATSGTPKDKDEPNGKDEAPSDVEMHKEPYAVASESDNLVFTELDPEEGLGSDKAEALYAIKSNMTYSDGKYSNGTIYRIEFVTEDFTDIYRMEQIAEITVFNAMGERKVELMDLAAKVGVTDEDKSDISALFESFDRTQGIEINSKKANSLLSFKGMEVLVIMDSKASYSVYAPVLVAMSSRNIYDHDDTDEGVYADTYAFRHAYETAIANGEKSFSADGMEFTIETDDYDSSVLKDGKLFAYVSNMKVIPDASRAGLELDLEFKNKVRSICRSMTSAEQSGKTFTHEVWVKGGAELRTTKFEVVYGSEQYRVYIWLEDGMSL